MRQANNIKLTEKASEVDSVSLLNLEYVLLNYP